MLQKLLTLFLVTLLSHLLSITTNAQQKSPRYVSLAVENDIFVPPGDDRHYTSGMRLMYGLDGTGDWYTWLENLSLVARAANSEYELVAGQNIYTPEAFLEPRPILNDRPYAGWLYGEINMVRHAPGLEEAVAFNLGMIGPVALGEEVQKLLHDIVGDPEPAGWDNQLHNEPALLMRYRRSWFLPLQRSNNLSIDIVPRTGINLGNVFTDAAAGLVLRLGNHLPERDLTARAQPGLSGNSGYVPVRVRQFDWMIYTEVQGRAVARNIFLDGNTFADSLSVDRRKYAWEAGAGFILGIGQLRYPLFFSFSFIWRGREFKQQFSRDSFGSAFIGVQY